ncbi:FUSC family protein [Nonomuraea soli]|uniref:Putative membrane protein YccC n=1 Tax=Nonomuraea soli TaxID=1032476 RepID=A0A7W0HQ76_9ACTN|nr:FUSC family protein [Nonomuraea soli]MBA2891356.1 putative membrane protein YccC [Nonomuraea soli]
MRATAARALRRGFELPARPPWGYGVLCAVSMALPLVAGLVGGHPHYGSIAALGAYFTAFGDVYGKPYGVRARRVLATVALISAAFWLGALLSPFPAAAIVAVGLVAAAGAQWRTFGVPPALALVVGYYDALPIGWTPPLMLAGGGLLYAVLALAAWPFNRLDPLTSALSQACTAAASLLDGLKLGEEEWHERRQRLSKAIGAAATASASFHSSDDHDRTPDNYVGVLRRVFHETVALRVLVEGMGRAPDPRAAVGALAGALREAAAGSAVGVPVALSAVAAYAEQVKHATAKAGETSAELARLAAVRRCLDRMAAAVRTAGLLASQGVHAPERRPRLAWPELKEPAHAARVGLTTALAMALMIGFHAHHGRWFVFMVLMAMRSTYGDTVERVVLRVAGTVVGATVAALILALVPGRFTIVGIVLVFGTAGFALREVSFGYWSILATPLALMLSDFATTLDWPAAAARLGLTAAGGVLALLAARVLWPRGEAGKPRGYLVDLLVRHASLVRTLAEGDLKAVPERIVQAGDAAVALDESLARLAKEPPMREAPKELVEAVAISRRIRDDSMLMSAVLGGQDGADGAVVAVLDTVADQLEALARAVQDGEEPPRLGRLDAAGRELTARPALRALCEDVVQLASSASAASISSRGMPSR